jgi:hypothetical protein
MAEDHGSDTLGKADSGLAKEGRTMPGWKTTRVICVATVTLLALDGCSLFRQDGWDDSSRTFDIPVRNFAIETPPYVNVMGDPFPDRAWIRERYSECEPWQVGQNGCPGSAPHATPVHVTTGHTARPHKKKPVGS